MQDEILPHLKVTCKSHVLLVEVRGSVNMERVEIFDFSLGSGSQTSLSCISILSCPSVLDWAHFTIKPKNMNSSSLCIGSWVITPAKGPHSLQGYPQWAFWIERFSLVNLFQHGFRYSSFPLSMSCLPACPSRAEMETHKAALLKVLFLQMHLWPPQGIPWGLAGL